MGRLERFMPHSTAMKIAGAYAVLGILWILFSDLIVARLASSPSQLTTLQTLKGWAFVVVSAGILYGMVYREHQRLLSTNDELEKALQQAHILHRILRHNLRNICTIIGGSVLKMESQPTDYPTSPLDTLKRQNERLINLSDKSHFLKIFLTGDRGETHEYDIVELVQAEVKKARDEYESADISATLPQEARVRAHYLIDEAIEELIENAIIHNKSKDPTVRLSVQRGKRWTTLIVDDNGPGIPLHEQRALRQRFETSLDHSQGLGLWLLHLTIEQSDGELGFEDVDEEGSRVLVKLPSA